MRPLPAAALVAFMALAGCQEDLYTNLDEREANMMIATLEENGIPAERIVQSDGRMAVTVDRARFAAAVRLLDEAGLPRQRFASMGEVFQQEGLVASPLQERSRLLYALSEEMSRTVSEIDGIQSARVHIVLPENDALRRDTTGSSAAVFVRHDPAMDIEALIPKIKTLVANGIAGLSYDRVSVVTVAAAAPTHAQSEEPMRSFLGIWIHARSYDQAMALIGSLAGMVVVLAGAIGFLWWRRARGPEHYRLERPE